MKSLTPKQVAIYIAIVAVIVFLLLLLISLSLPTRIMLITSLLSASILFCCVYFFSRHILIEFIIEKINPIYRTLHNINIQNKEKKEYLEGKDIITEIRNDVSAWTNNKSQEIAQLKELEKYRKEFLGNVSHELKTPIFNIQGYILTLLDGGLEDPAINRLYLERTEKSINRMINIVEDLESISRLESGELKLQFEDINIISLVEDVFEMQEMLAKNLKIKLSFGANYDKPIKVKADKKKITEVLNNLIVNSIKYGKKNGKTTITFIDIGEQVLIEVTDNGIGIAEKDLSRIFERFYRTDKSRSRDLGGTGLGLSIAKHIMEAHNQTIQVRSKIGEGSTFTLTLNKS